VAIPSFSDNALASIRQTDSPASPEEIFLAWLLSLPDGVDAPEAAAAEIVRLDRARVRSRARERLRELFVAAAEYPVPEGRLS
jgi:hypothetical protein